MKPSATGILLAGVSKTLGRVKNCRWSWDLPHNMVTFTLQHKPNVEDSGTQAKNSANSIVDIWKGHRTTKKPTYPHFFFETKKCPFRHALWTSADAKRWNVERPQREAGPQRQSRLAFEDVQQGRFEFEVLCSPEYDFGTLPVLPQDHLYIYIHTQWGDMAWKLVVQLRGPISTARFRASCQAKAPRLGKFRLTYAFLQNHSGALSAPSSSLTLPPSPLHLT